ncbi:MAG: hypothetical protein PUP93_06635 [Rhizonema sp. NSF051]|nr:hypothetical protein [Rhizonema sp. NSF051]
MNRYEIFITGNDILGFDFINKIVKYANMGAVISDKEIPRVKNFPQTVRMYLETTDALKEEPGVRLAAYREVVPYTKEELDAMSWDELKAAAKLVGLTGRDRDKLTREYLAEMDKE